MKKSSIFLFTATLFLFASCQKEHLIDPQIDHTSGLSSTTIQAINCGTREAIKQSYLLLSHDEQQKLWNAKWNAILVNDAKNLSVEQIRVVTMIKKFVDEKTVAGLFKKPEDGRAFYEANIKDWERYFSQAQLHLLLEGPYFCNNFSIFSAETYLTKIDDSSALRPNQTCKCYYSVYCLTELCVTGGCTLSDGGCGIIGSTNCNGLCGGGIN